MRRFATLVARLAVVLLLGGFLGATLVRFAPGYGVDEAELDSRLNDASVLALRQAHSTDESIGRYYLHYLENLMHGDLGVSRALHQPVRTLLAERFPETLKSVGYGLLLGWVLALGLALLPMLMRSRAADMFAGLFAGAFLCLPAATLALFFVMAHETGRLAIGLIVFPKVYRFARNLVTTHAAQAHILTAWAKGLGSFPILMRHILPAMTPQLLALAGVSVSIAFAAAIPVEAICDLPGIGQLAWQAALGRDMELLVNLTMVVTLITLLSNTGADLLNGRKAQARASA